MLSTSGSQCQPSVENDFYWRLVLTTACINSSIEAVVNTTRVYKDFCNFFIIVFYIFGNYVFIAYFLLLL